MKLRLFFFLLLASSVFAQSTGNCPPWTCGGSTDKMQGQGDPPTTAPFPVTFPSSTFKLGGTTSSAFKIYDHGKLVLTLSMDGKVTYGEGYEPNKAAKLFWYYVERNAPAPPAATPCEKPAK